MNVSGCAQRSAEIEVTMGRNSLKSKYLRSTKIISKFMRLPRSENGGIGHFGNMGDTREKWPKREKGTPNLHKMHLLRAIVEKHPSES